MEYESITQIDKLQNILFSVRINISDKKYTANTGATAVLVLNLFLILFSLKGDAVIFTHASE